MPTIAVWHDGMNAAMKFANGQGSHGDGLVTLIPDSQTPHCYWGVYKVPPETYTQIINTPRLRYKDGQPW